MEGGIVNLGQQWEGLLRPTDRRVQGGWIIMARHFSCPTISCSANAARPSSKAPHSFSREGFSNPLRSCVFSLTFEGGEPVLRDLVRLLPEPLHLVDVAVEELGRLGVGQDLLALGDLLEHGLLLLVDLVEELLLLVDEVLGVGRAVRVDVPGGLGPGLLHPVHVGRQLVGELVGLPQAVHGVLGLVHLGHDLVVPRDGKGEGVTGISLSRDGDVLLWH